MTYLQVPMRPKSELAIEQGNKIMTTRGKPLGASGDTFSAAGIVQVLLGTFDLSVKYVMDYFYDMEGFGTPEEFQKEWMSINWGRWQPDKVKVCNVFVPIWTSSMLRLTVREAIIARLAMIPYKPMEFEL